MNTALLEAWGLDGANMADEEITQWREKLAGFMGSTESKLDQLERSQSALFKKVEGIESKLPTFQTRDDAQRDLTETRQELRDLRAAVPRDWIRLVGLGLTLIALVAGAVVFILRQGG